MRKQSKNTTVIRINLENGNFTTVSRAILENPNLKDSSKTLLQLCLNNVAEWELRVTHYKKLLGWCNDKMARTIVNLIENGYMTRKKHPKGKGKGFYYSYVISEYGNLNPHREVVSKEVILNDIAKEEPEQENTHEEITEPIQVDQELKERLCEIFGEVIWKKTYDPNFVKNVIDYYMNQLSDGELNKSNFNEEAIRKLLKERLTKSNNAILAQIESWIDLNNNRGTIAQKSNIKAKALERFKEQLRNGQPIDEREVKTRLLYLRSEIIDANRVIDQRYND